jgi:hypothetical protein
MAEPTYKDMFLGFLEQLRLEFTFFLAVFIWRLNHRFGPDIEISEVLRSVANRFEPNHPGWADAIILN